MDHMHTTLSNVRMISEIIEHTPVIVHPNARHGRLPRPAKVQRRLAVLKAGSWLRSLGFYGSIILTPRSESDSTRIMIGFKLPAWMSNISIDLDLEFARLSTQGLGVRILPGEIKIQSRVSRDSPFMLACMTGDVMLIKQHLEEKTASVRDRTSCTGSTPLMVSHEAMCSSRTI
jgi:hypothetical protein